MRPLNPAKVTLALLASLGLGSSCHLVAVGAAGVVVSQEFIKNAHAHLVIMEPTLVWAHSKAVLAEMAEGPIEVDDLARAGSATIDSATVTVHVEHFDETRTRLTVAARKWGMYDDAIAERVISRIKRNLQ